MTMNQLSAGQRWFLDKAGQTLPWSEISSADPRITSQAKGIYKPANHTYALSIKETLTGDYPDKEPIYRENGSWLYEYYQEGSDPNDRDKKYTNRAMMACIKDRIPVGVMIQRKPKPGVEYEILGLAYVTGWDDGYFYLESYSETSNAKPGPQTEIEQLSRSIEELSDAEGRYNPESTPDTRRKIVSSIIQRRGQTKFRQQLIDAYGGRCAITGCDATSALEAAHITPYKGQASNVSNNGLLLRADIHTLWDLGLIAVDPTNNTILLAQELQTSSYSSLQGQPIRQPTEACTAASKDALLSHLEWSGLKITT